MTPAVQQLLPDNHKEARVGIVHRLDKFPFLLTGHDKCDINPAFMTERLRILKKNYSA